MEPCRPKWTIYGCRRPSYRSRTTAAEAIQPTSNETSCRPAVSSSTTNIERIDYCLQKPLDQRIEGGDGEGQPQIPTAFHNVDANLIRYFLVTTLSFSNVWLSVRNSAWKMAVLEKLHAKEITTEVIQNARSWIQHALFEWMKRINIFSYELEAL